MNPSLTIIIPAYNEEVRIADSLAEVFRFARERDGDTSIVVVDDGSTDATVELARQAQAEPGAPPLEIVRHPVNRGKGASVRTGFAHATGEIVMFTDADLSSPMSETPRLIGPIIAGDYDIVVGSRALDRSRIAVHQSRLRENAGKLFNAVVRLITGLPIWDTQCGFKAFRRESVAPVFAMQRLDGFAFDVELLFIAARLGLRTLEIPVGWSHVAGSKVSMARDSRRAFIDLLRIRINAWRGRYPHRSNDPRDAGKDR